MPSKRRSAKGSGAPSRSQILWSLAYSMIPLIGFWLIEEWKGLEAGLVAAVALALAEIAWVYAHERRWEMLSVWSAVLIVALGALSWKLQSHVAVLLKPAIVEGVVALVLLVSSAAGKPFMLAMAKKQFGDADFGEAQFRYLSGVNWRMGLLFLLHVAITVYAAFRLSTRAYILVKGGLFYAMFALFFALEFAYSRLVVRPKMIEEAQKQRAFLEYQRQLIERMRKGE